jgi:hypothetical protein
MNHYALDESLTSPSQVASAIVIRAVAERDETARHLRGLYREMSKPDAEDSSTYGCVDWYLYSQAHRGLGSLRSSVDGS